MNATFLTVLEEYERTSPARGLPCARVNGVSISASQAVSIVREGRPEADAVMEEMKLLIKQFLKTNLI